MRPVVSTVGTAFYGTSKYLVDLLQPTLNKNLTRVKNSTSFAEEAREWSIAEDEIQVSYDVVNLYPSVPIGRSIKVVMDLVSDNYDEISERTKLSVLDIEKLLKLCLSKCYFLWDNKIFVIEDAGPIGLSLMVTMAEAYLQFLEAKALRMALDFCPKTFRRYVDDSHGRFGNLQQAEQFLQLLNSQDPKIQYTMEAEDANGTLAFLDISIRNNKSGRYELSIYRKEAITNLQILPNSSVDPSTVVGVFKGFLTRAHRICSTSRLHEEIRFLINMFVENGYERRRFEEISKCFTLSKVVQSENLSETDQQTTPIVKLPWIPKIGSKLRKAYKKHGVRVVFTSGPNLKDILSQHKCPLPKNSQPGVYKLECNCSVAYIGETKNRVSTRVRQHQKDVFHGRWSMSGAAEHAKVCSQGFKFDSASTLSVEHRYLERKVREAVEIRKSRRSSTTVVNRDSGNYMKTNQWDVLLARI